MRENEKLIINVEALFPEAARRVKILEDMQKFWAGIVGGNLARKSYPEVLGVNEIYIKAKDDKAAGTLFNMKGNIIRKLKSLYDYDVNENFEVKINL